MTPSTQPEFPDLKEKLFAHFKAGFCLVNSSGRIAEANSGFCDFLGYSLEELRQIDIRHITGHDWQAATEQLMDELLSGRQSHIEIEKQYIRKNGEHVWGHTTAFLLNAADGDQYIFAGIESRQENRHLSDKQANAENLQALVFENNPDLVFVKNEALQIIMANAAFLSLYPEHMRDSIIGSTTVEDFDSEQAENFLAQDRLAFQTGFTETTEQILFPNGEQRILETRKIRFHDSANEAFILGISRDVTRQAQLIEQLQRTNSDLDEFTYIASHDLKSPVNAIRQLADWIEEDAADQLPESAQQHLKLLQSRSQRLLTLLDDLLQYAKIDKKTYPFETVDVEQSVRGILEYYNADITCDFYSNLTTYTAPRIPLETVLRNLISNAVKHHPQRKPALAVHLLRDRQWDRLIFEDDGTGIPTELRDSALQVFKTLKPRDQVEGSGIGLSLIKKITEHFSGQLILDQAERGGLQVTLRWPRDHFFKPTDEDTSQ